MCGSCLITTSTARTAIRQNRFLSQPSTGHFGHQSLTPCDLFSSSSLLLCPYPCDTMAHLVALSLSVPFEPLTVYHVYPRSYSPTPPNMDTGDDVMTMSATCTLTCERQGGIGFMS